MGEAKAKALQTRLAASLTPCSIGNMGKASSNKKVARAAKAGGRARSAGERNVMFPVALALVVVLGTLLVVYAREERSAEALKRPIANEDHWHAAFGFYVCDEPLPDLPEYHPPQNRGIHGHGDGLIHIHPFSTARSGELATLRNFIADGGEVLGGGDQLEDDRLGVPGDQTYIEGENSCDGVDGDPIVQVAVWDTGFAAINGQEPDRVVTKDFGSIRFDEDGQVYTIAFAPPGAEIPPPPQANIERLGSVGSDLGVPAEDIPEGAELGEDFGTPEPADGDAETDAGGDAEGDDDTSVDDTSSTTTEPGS